MENGEKLDVGALHLYAQVIVASGRMSVADVERAGHEGMLTMARNGLGTAYLEVGGVLVAEGSLKKKKGKSAFVVTRVFDEGTEVRV